jgi:integrase
VLRPVKNRKEHDAPLAESLRPILAEHIGLSRRQASRRRAPGERHKARRDQGMYALRHTAASAWLSAGADIVAVAAWLGGTVRPSTRLTPT